MLNETEAALLTCLLELEQTVKSMAQTQPKPSLLPLFARLDELTGLMPSDSAPVLLHYLHKKSYEKARLWLQGRESENTLGSCGPHV